MWEIFAVTPHHEWTGWVQKIYVGSHVATTAAHMAILATLLTTLCQEKSKHRARAAFTASERLTLRTVYAVVICVSGLGHLEGLFAFVWPTYHFFAFWHLATALVSWLAVMVTFVLRAKILAEL